MDTPDVDVDRAVERLVADQVQEASEREGIARARDERRGPGAKHDDVVERPADELSVRDQRRSTRRARSDRGGDIVAQTGQDDLPRVRERDPEVIGAIVIWTSDHPGATTRRWSEPPAL